MGLEVGETEGRGGKEPVLVPITTGSVVWSDHSLNLIHHIRYLSQEGRGREGEGGEGAGGTSRLPVLNKQQSNHTHTHTCVTSQSYLTDKYIYIISEKYINMSLTLWSPEPEPEPEQTEF